MIRAIFAVEQNLGYANNGTLPDWNSKADFKHFKESTSGHVVVMGSGTWEDPMMKRPLPNRINCVVSSRDDLIDIDKVYHMIGGREELEDQLLEIEKRYPDKDVVIIGGWNIIAQCLSVIDKIELTIMHGHYETDKRVPFGHLTGFSLGEAFELSDGKGQVVEYIR
jgi:dihydrofolate reductase